MDTAIIYMNDLKTIPLSNRVRIATWKMWELQNKWTANMNEKIFFGEFCCWEARNALLKAKESGLPLDRDMLIEISNLAEEMISEQMRNNID